MKRLVSHFLLIGKAAFGVFLVWYGIADAASFSWPAPPDPQKKSIFGCHIEKRYPHDPAAFTQGFLFAKDHLFEGTGLYGFSSLRKVDLASGAVLTSLPLPSHLFGEGIALVREKIYQLTWRSNEVRVYELSPLRLNARLFWPYQGWGITYYNRYLVISDGSDRLFFVDPDTFTIKTQINVREDDRPLDRLNELESVGNYILANIWQTTRIAVIIPASGQVAAWIDLRAIASKEPAGVANGIAWDPVNRRLFLTGKRWSHVYEVTLSTYQK